MTASSLPAPRGASPSWRSVLRIHPAAELFPLMASDELRALGEDIKKNGLKSRIVFWKDGAAASASACLLDGRNRLDALEAVGEPLVKNETRSR
jgi:hypothetical protein